MKQEVLDFLEEIKVIYLDWLRINNSVAFPRCCFTASEVLGSYLQERFGVGNIYVCKYSNVKDNEEKEEFGENAFVHMRINIDNEIIDFTYFQFLEKEDKLKEYATTLTAEDLYDKCISELQGHYLFNDTNRKIIEHCSEEFMIQPRFNGFVKNRDFKAYLKYLERLKIFKEYDFYKIIPEDEFWFWD